MPPHATSRSRSGSKPLAPVASGAGPGALEHAAARIGLAVNLGLLAPGERLPPAAELSETFGVSRATVRRALQLLTTRSVLERRRGRLGGTFVAADPPREVLHAFEAYRTVGGEIVELIDYRLVLECGTVHLAAERATAEDVARLRDMVRAMAAAQTLSEFRRIDPRFHLEVARISGSGGATRELAAVLGRLFRFYLPYPMAYLWASNHEHGALVDAIEARDARAAVAVIEAHISELYGTIFVSPDERS